MWLGVDHPVDSTMESGESSSSLSTHQLHMKAALNDCKEQVERLRELLQLSNSTAEPAAPSIIEHLLRKTNGYHINQLFHSAWVSSNSLQQERELGLRRLNEKLAKSSVGNHNDDDDDDDIEHMMCPIDVLHVNEEGWCKEEEDNTGRTIVSTPSKFKEQYCFRNVPCIIRGFNELNFKNVSQSWTTYASDNDITSINYSWFERHVGEDTMVPVRIDEKKVELDEDGRAEECATKMMSLKDWIMRSREDSSNEEEYLKDWHLLQLLKSRQPVCDAATSHLLYKTPQYFERDILDNFLERYSNGGDYKFVYWGPSRSQTRLHSDVLHSYSWSYNVVGAKKWTFHIPDSSSDNNVKDVNASSKIFEVIQRTGETIFVPSKWKHEVTNLVETISINHNWITSANIDNTWQCIYSEIKAIEGEINEWGVVPSDDFEARENMLRGCIGLDVTMFILMLLLEVSELLAMVFASIDDETRDDDATYDYLQSVYNLIKVLDDVSACQEANAVQRLQAVIGSKTEAVQVQECVTFVTRLTDILKEPLPP